MKKDKDQSQYYHISSVARLYNIHPQTLRLYEREGLLKPSRSEGNTRLYSDDDLRQLEVILNLSRDLGVNLAGIEIILSMRRRLLAAQAERTRRARIRQWPGLPDTGDLWQRRLPWEPDRE